VLRGLSARKYQETLLETSEAFGVSSNTVSRQLLAVTTQKLKEFKERDLSGVRPIAILIDTLHRQKLPGVLRKTLTSTNPIESIFSTVRDCEGNIKRYRSSAMSQRWLGTVLLHCEKGLRRVKGDMDIPGVIVTIEQVQEAA